MAHFRFEDLDVWRNSIMINDKLFDIAKDLETRKYYRFADQVRGAALSISNNIAEGSASPSAKEFKRYLNIARGSVFENANMLYILEHRGLIDRKTSAPILNDLNTLSSQLINLGKAILKKCG